MSKSNHSSAGRMQPKLLTTGDEALTAEGMEGIYKTLTGRTYSEQEWDQAQRKIAAYRAKNAQHFHPENKDGQPE